jgi:hypothetical protein
MTAKYKKAKGGEKMKRVQKKLHTRYEQARQLADDLRLLQKRVSGMNVYKHRTKVYRRTPKHRKLVFQD